MKERDKSNGHLIPTEDLPILQEVGPRHGIIVGVVAKEGEEYAHVSNSLSFFSNVYQGIVPEGRVYVEISSPKRDMSDFWGEVRAKQKELANPLNHK